uniref:Uncharacterized protein n=1 Tax=Nymphaea colorata TaxID=210225 RepID=A0A5K1BYF1_9MAGN
MTILRLQFNDKPITKWKMGIQRLLISLPGLDQVLEAEEIS